MEKIYGRGGGGRYTARITRFVALIAVKLTFMLSSIVKIIVIIIDNICHMTNIVSEEIS